MNGNASRMVSVMAVVALVLCSGVIVFSPDADAVGSEEEVYTLEMRTGQTCIYVPTTNLDSEITVTGSEGVTWDAEKGTMNATFGSIDTSGDLNAVVKAVWTSTVDPSVTQSAEQTIIFKIYGHVTIDGYYESSVSKGVIGGQPAGTVVYSPTISQATSGTETVVTCDIPENDYIGWDAENRRVVIVEDIPEDVDAFSVSFDIIATNSSLSEGSSLADETATVHVTVGFGQDLTITSPDIIETYIGCDDAGRNTYVVQTNYDDAEFVSVTGIQIGQVVPSVAGLVASKGDGTVTFDPDAVEFPDRPVRPYYQDYTFSVTVSGTSADGTEVQDSKIVTLRVWAGLNYITMPSMEDVIVQPDEGNKLSVTVSALIGDADGISFDWGDGSDVSDQKTRDDTTARYSASHDYELENDYLITVSAYNSSGENVVYIMYDTTTGQSYETDPPTPEQPEEPSGDEGYDLWWLPIVLGVLAVVFAVAFAVRPGNYALVALAVICALAAVASYFLM